MKSKTTRRALVLSLLSLLLCCSMLVGTTFAWFTDSVTSGRNQIVAGNLDITLDYYDATTKTFKEVTENVKLFDDNSLWEPGHTEIAYLKVANAGTLALKYQLAVNVYGEKTGINVEGKEFALSDYLVFKVIEVDETLVGTYTRETARAEAGAEMGLKAYNSGTKTMEAGAEPAYVMLVIYMPESVGNEANHKTGTPAPSIEMGVTLEATQLANEYDSFGNDYDAEADGTLYDQLFTFGTEADLNAFDPTPNDGINNSGLRIENGAAIVEGPGAWYPMDANLTSEEYTVSYGLDITAMDEGQSITVDTGDATTWGSTPFLIERGSAKVYYGTAKNEYIGTLEGTVLSITHTYALNADGELVITTVISDGAASLSYSKAVATGNQTELYWDIYSVTEADKVTLNDFHFSASKGKVDSAPELSVAIAEAKDGDVIVLDGNITGADGFLIENKDLTIDLNGKTISVSEGASTSNRVFKITGDSKVTIKNGTLVAEGTINSGAYGTIRTEGTANVTLENLKLYNYRGGGLNVKAVTGTTVTINNCEIYSQYGGGVEASGGKIVLNNTKIDQKGVYSNGWYSVAMEINSSGSITVNSGEYSGSAIATDANAAMGNCVAFILSSGGTLTINGGTFNAVVAETADASNFCGIIYADRAAVVNINGGTFNSNGAILDMRNNAGSQPNPKATLAGGTFSSDPRVSGLYSSNLIKVAEGYIATQNADGTWKVAYDGAEVTNADELATALASGEKILLKNDIEYQSGIVLAEGASLDGNGKTITYTGTEYTYHLVKLNTGATVENVTLENYRVRTESTTNGTVTLKNVTINMDNDETGLDISRGAGTAKLTNVTCKGTKDAAHLDPNTQVQVDYTPYGDVLLGGAWALEATDCDFGSLHGWNTRNGSNVYLNNTTYTVFRMHYWSNRTLYIDGVETAWSESGAIPVAHDVGGCWSVQSAFK